MSWTAIRVVEGLLVAQLLSQVSADSLQTASAASSQLMIMQRTILVAELVTLTASFGQTQLHQRWMTIHLQLQEIGKVRKVHSSKWLYLALCLNLTPSSYQELITAISREAIGIQASQAMVQGGLMITAKGAGKNKRKVTHLFISLTQIKEWKWSNIDLAVAVT